MVYRKVVIQILLLASKLLIKYAWVGTVNIATYKGRLI